MQRILHSEDSFGKRPNGYFQKEKEMGTMIVAVKGFFWTVGNWMLLAIGMATPAKLALYLGMISAAVQIGYTSYKWGKEIITDLRTGKKKFPIRTRKKLKP